jgi:protein-tyrosine phosphatase
MKVFWVSKRLAFGSAITTWQHVEKLQSLGVTHVINLRHGKHGKKVWQFKNLWLPFRDDRKSRPRWFYRRALRFYNRAMRKPNTKVFVMCHHGISRSPSLTYFLLRGASGFTHARAQSAVLRVRPRAIIARAYRESGEIFLFFDWAIKKQPRD